MNLSQITPAKERIGTRVRLRGGAWWGDASLGTGTVVAQVVKFGHTLYQIDLDDKNTEYTNNLVFAYPHEYDLL